MEVGVWIADEELNFELHQVFPGEVGSTEQGRFTDIDLEGISTQAIRLMPKYQGWGHQWGEVEFWVYDSGNFEAPVQGLAKGQSYFYRSFVSNSGGTAWAPSTQSFEAEDRVRYEDGKLIIHTDLATWKHSNGDSRAGTIIKKSWVQSYWNDTKFT